MKSYHNVSIEWEVVLPEILRIKFFKKSAGYKCKSTIDSLMLPLVCPKCQSEMKITSFITEPFTIMQILEHLGLWRTKPSRDPPEDAISHVVYEPFKPVLNLIQ